MKQTNDIFLGYKQLTFGFDQTDEQDEKRLLLYINKKINDCEVVTLHQVVSQFSCQPDTWAIKRILLLIENLFLDIKIQFLVNGRKLLPQNIRNCLSDPDQFENTEIVKPEIVSKNALTGAQHLCGKVFTGSCDRGQNSLCRFIRKHFRHWKNDLVAFQKLADTGRYPGKHEIKDVLLLIDKFQLVYDPKEFITFFLDKKEALLNASRKIKVLTSFYTDQIHTWKNLIEAVDTFKQERQKLEKDANVQKALKRLFEISESHEPYNMVREVPHLISVVKPAHKMVIKEKTEARRMVVIHNLKGKTEQIKSILKDKQANSNMCNRALLPFQNLRRKLNNASNISLINQYANDVSDEFDMTLLMLE